MELLTTFKVFLKTLQYSHKKLFLLGAISSALAGICEAYLFANLNIGLNEGMKQNLIISIVILLVFRFLWVYVASFLISRGATDVTIFLMSEIIKKNEDKDSEFSTLIPKVITESERIGMGYYLAGQNLLSNTLQLLALFFTAALVTSREFIIIVIIIIPFYLLFLFASTKNVKHFGQVRMDAIRTLTSSLSKKYDFDDYSVFKKLGLGIFRVRIWSLIQKPSLELIGISALAGGIAIDYFFFSLQGNEILISYSILAGIMLRAFPYINQIQNAITLASSVHHEVVSMNNEKD